MLPLKYGGGSGNTPHGSLRPKHPYGLRGILLKFKVMDETITNVEIQHEWIEIQKDAYSLFERIQATCGLYEDAGKHFQPFRDNMREIIELIPAYIFDESDHK